MKVDSIAELRQKIVSGVISSEEVTLDILSKIHNSGLNCFISVLPDALDYARDVDKRIKSGFRGRLAGVPVAVKDNMRCKGTVTTCGSAVLNKIDNEDCAVVKKLRAEGAVIVGKTNMDEFAMGSSNTTSAYGPVLNPLNRECVPGGSSGGSAAAVSAGLCYGALGSDTGGSIRQPASYCGVVGLKPTFGTVDAFGMYALSQDMDQVGPITKTVGDSKLMYEVISGRTIDEPDCYGLKVGFIAEFEDWLNDDTRLVMRRAKEILSKFGCTFIEVSAPSVNAAFATYRVLGNIQSANNLRSIGSVRERADLGFEVKKRILIGEYAITHPEITDKAKRVRRRITTELDRALEICDVLVSPSAPSTAFTFEADRSSKEIVFSDIFTQPPSIAGLPALSVPCVTCSDGMPIGVQLVSKRNEEGLLFALGRRFEDQ